MRVVTSARAELRLREAAAWLEARGADEQILIIGATHDAASELIREVARVRGTGFGWHRMTLGRLAAELAALPLAAEQRAPVGVLPVEALCVRVLHAMQGAGTLGRLEAVVEQPGLPRALARTLGELRMARMESSRLGPEMRAAMERLADELDNARLADRAAVFAVAEAIARANRADKDNSRRGADDRADDDRAADARAGAGRTGRADDDRAADARAVAGRTGRAEADRAIADRAVDRARVAQPLLGLPTLVLDVRVRTRAEQTLLEAVLDAAPDALITVAAGDDATLARLGGKAEQLVVPEADALSRVQKHLFDRGRLNYAQLDRSIEIFSAPGESRECVELARRVLAEAEAGVPFDRMAIVLRTPNHYRAHLEEAFNRADVPIWFEHGTVRPHPSGRAFLTLIACAVENLSARRFAEYISLGEIPDAVAGEPPPAVPAAERWVAPDEELSPAAIGDAEKPDRVEQRHPVAVGEPVASGTLRAPWRWERLIVEASVIGGRDRWARRLAGLEAKLALETRGGESGREQRTRQLAELAHLRSFALPLLDELAALPARATWGEWIDRLSALATRTLRAPERVLAVLSALVPMSDVGSVSLREIQLVLAPRLAEVIVPRTTRRYGHVLVATVEAIRGMAFDVVFIPGLAERMFPQKVIEDPLLLDDVRTELGELVTRDGRVADERLSLRLAIGAACKRAVVSYPRIDLDQGRPRVPSFYGLEVLEAAEGALPGFDELGKKADATGAARIGWPAPADRERAIDEAEHDLALLDSFLRPDGATFAATASAPVAAVAARAASSGAAQASLRFDAVRDERVIPFGKGTLTDAVSAEATARPDGTPVDPSRDPATEPTSTAASTVLPSEISPRKAPAFGKGTIAERATTLDSNAPPVVDASGSPTDATATGTTADDSPSDASSAPPADDANDDEVGTSVPVSARRGSTARAAVGSPIDSTAKPADGTHLDDATSAPGSPIDSTGAAKPADGTHLVDAPLDDATTSASGSPVDATSPVHATSARSTEKANSTQGTSTADAATARSKAPPLGKGTLPGTPRLAPQGAAAYLLSANPHLARSLRSRARRWTVAAWKPSDGLIAETDHGRTALVAHSPDRRSFSPTALELLAQCPYRFALRAIVKLEPREQPEAIETLGPLERGSLIHDVHFELLSELREAGELPITSFEAVRERIDVVLARVAARYRDDLSPAIERVWDDGIAAIGSDVREWVRRMIDDPSWIPRRFELAFGPVGRGVVDPNSVSDPVDLGLTPPLSLRGSIDLVEESLDGALRATDYKTGAAKVKDGAITAGGTSLQPVLYALVLERLFTGTQVRGSRLYYCTSRGEFREVTVPLDAVAREAARVLSETLSAHFERSFFPAAPARGACTYCDFVAICGPFEEARQKVKRDTLVQLGKLRGLR